MATKRIAFMFFGTRKDDTISDSVRTFLFGLDNIIQEEPLRREDEVRGN
jgi:hypothetical protein